MMNTALAFNDEYWQAFVAADADYDGLFWVGVETTGIFCRPSCRARKPLKQNCQVFDASEQALEAGFRPCKRCKPELLAHEHPRWVQRVLNALHEHPEHRLKDEDVAALHVSPVRLRRYFHRRYQCTFQQWQRQQRVSMTQQKMREGARLSEAVTGFQSEGGYRAALKKLIDAPNKHSNAVMAIQHLSTPLGDMLAGVIDEKLVLLEFVVKQRHLRQLKIARRLFQASLIEQRSALHETLQQQLNEYFAGIRKSFSIPMQAPGTEFQQKVWQQLLAIPYGETRAYQALAEQVGVAGASRAVGTANGANRIAILVPCHRVINKSGNLGGYGGGLRRKSQLLALERGQPRT